MNSDQDSEFGGVTMPTKPTTGRIRTQEHSTGEPADGYNSSDDDKAAGYGTTDGPNRGATTKRQS